jgi:transposase-like protein
MVEIPEEQHGPALRRVAQAAARRADAMAEVDRRTEELREAAVQAAQVGAGRSRIRELAQVSPTTLYGWLNDAGVEIRAKRPAGERTGTDA